MTDHTLEHLRSVGLLDRLRTAGADYMRLCADVESQLEELERQGPWPCDFELLRRNLAAARSGEHRVGTPFTIEGAVAELQGESLA